MATALHRELTTLRTEFKAAHDRLFSYEIILEQPHVLDERINRITVRIFIFPTFLINIMESFEKRHLIWTISLDNRWRERVWLFKKLNVSFLYRVLFFRVLWIFHIYFYTFIYGFTYIDCIKICIYILSKTHKTFYYDEIKQFLLILNLFRIQLKCRKKCLIS